MEKLTEDAPVAVDEPAEKELISPEHYQATLERLELQGLALDSMSAWCDRDNVIPAETVININGEASESKSEDKYLVFMKYNIKGVRESQTVFEFNAHYRLTFGCEHPVPDGFFEVYQSLNLQLTTMPYFREFVSSISSRLDIPTFTLPYKIFGDSLAQEDTVSEITK